MRRLHRTHLLMSVFALLLLAELAVPVAPLLARDGPVHVITRGETLAEVAARYDTTVATLARLNQIEDVRLVWTGMRIKLPVTGISDWAPTAAALPAPEALVTHRVAVGETLAGLARYYHTSLAVMVELNRISPAATLAPGRIVRAPATGVKNGAFSNAVAADQAMRAHVVQPDEGLVTIADYYGINVRSLARANGLSTQTRLRPGQVLQVPPPSLVDLYGAAPAGADGYHVKPTLPRTDERWIDIDLSEQRMEVYEGQTFVRSFIISSGRRGTPTVTGIFRIWGKTPVQDMSGGSRANGTYYYVSRVPWVQYFFEGYALHGAYWHDKFGQPMSHGCINMKVDEAEWLFQWASPVMEGKGWLRSDEEHPGTLVIVHD